MNHLFSKLKNAFLYSGGGHSGKIPPGRIGKSPRKIRPNMTGGRHSKTEPAGNVFLYDSASGGSAKFRIELYRFLRNNISTINSAIWTWSKLCNSARIRRYDAQISPDLENEIDETLSALERRIFPFKFWRYGGFDALLDTMYNALFTDGAACGELVINPAGNGIEGFHPIDVAHLDFNLKNGEWEIYQDVNEHRVKLPASTLFYYGLDAEASDPRGRSLIASVPFVARIEQQLVTDMSKTVHNAGYHRLQVSITPPQKLAGESDSAFIQRANNYFDDTVGMMNELQPDDNPITWNDVEIKHIGPTNYSSIGAWYLSHRAIVEDICCGCHLDPFMLGYSYGTTQTWAKFKYEIVLSQVNTIQNAAAHFLDWLCDIELALKGIPIRVHHRFDNSKSFGMLEQRQAEQIHINNVLSLMNSGLITVERAMNLLEI